MDYIRYRSLPKLERSFLLKQEKGKLLLVNNQFNSIANNHAEEKKNGYSTSPLEYDGR